MDPSNIEALLSHGPAARHNIRRAAAPTATVSVTMNPQPRQATLVSPFLFRIEWRDGTVTEHAARTLRLACPCAQCIDEVTGHRATPDAGSVTPAPEPARRGWLARALRGVTGR